MAKRVRRQLSSLQSDHPGEHQCFWRCPVSSCPMWFSSELNSKDHLERIHNFKEGQGYSFKFGLEWFDRRSFFDRREVTGQSLWMDLALVRRSGHPLRNNYTITNSLALAPLRKFFHAAVRRLTSAYETMGYAQIEVDHAHKCAGTYLRSSRMTSYATPPLVVSTPVRSAMRNNLVPDIPSIWTIRPTTMILTSS